MRCYFIRRDHIVRVAVVSETADADAIAMAQTLFDEQIRTSSLIEFDGFELWDGARMVCEHWHNSMAR